MSVTEILLDRMHHRPEALAVRHARGDMNYGAFGSRVLRASGGLVGAGVRPGEVVALRLDDPLDHWLATLALAHMGATVVSVSRAMPDAQREALMASTRCTRVLAGDEYRDASASPGAPVLRWALARDHPGAAPDAPAAVAPDQPWAFVSGSGSTGRPKIIPITHRQELARREAARPCLPYGPDDIVHSLVGMHFSSAKHRALEAFSVGAAVSIGDPGRLDLRDEVEAGLVTVIHAMVFHVEKLLGMLPADVGQAYRRLTALMMAGSTVSMPLRERIRQRLTENLFLRWGANETGAATITRASEVFETKDGVGRPFPGYRIEVVDALGRRLPPGTDGRIRVSAPGVFDGYLGDPEATRQAFQDGGFLPGDIGHFTPDGQLVHRGRADDMMIVSGVNVYPAEIEACLKARADVADAHATPLRDEALQDVPVALVVAAPDAAPDPRALVEHVRSRIGRHTLYEVILVEDIPRNEQGKVQREQVSTILQGARRGRARAEPAARDRRPPSPGRRPVTMSIVFRRPPGARPGGLAQWLALLGDNGDPRRPAPAPAPDVDSPTARAHDWLGQVLSLARVLLHALRIPLFDRIEVLACRPLGEGENRWEAVCRSPDADLAPGRLLDGVLRVAFTQAATLLGADVADDGDRDRFFRAIEDEVLQPFAWASPNGKSTFEVLRVAHATGVPCRRLPGGAFLLGWGRRARRIDRSTTERDSALGVRWTHSKLVCAQMLREAGLPASENQRVDAVDQAREAATRLGFPVVVKPADGERGEGVTVDVGADGLEAAFDRARARSSRRIVLVERQVPGVCHRLFIVAGRLLYAVRRLPIGVHGDGRSPVGALVDAECRAQRRLPPWRRSGIAPLDDTARAMLARQGWTADSVPAAGAFVALRRIESTAWGGVDEEVTQVIHPDNVRAAVEAAALFGLEVAGVDMISVDIARPWHANGAVINEVNYAPLLGGGEISRRYVGEYLSRILADGGRIPVHVYAGGEGAWRAAEAHWARLRASGVCAYLTGDDRTLDGEGRACPMTAAGLHSRVQALLLRHDLEALIVVMQDEAAFREGPPLDRVASLEVVDAEIRADRAGDRPLPAPEAVALLRACRAWWPDAESIDRPEALDPGPGNGLLRR